MAQALSSAHKRCELLEGRCSSLEASWKEHEGILRLQMGASLVWDLSHYDGKDKESPKFEIPNGVQACLKIRRKQSGRFVDLCMDQKANVTGTLQVDDGVAKQFDFKRSTCVGIWGGR